MKEPASSTAEWNDEELDDSFRILSDPVRRHLLRRLSRERDVATIDELCDGLPTGSTGKPLGDETRIALLHAHLPMLADAGIIDFDRERETVRYRSGHRIESLLGLKLVTADA
ncbi:DUF7344 domain-containing protein [Halosolutus gelatinilyticus]|uniref:DUF7344 domain-containing protein n=1 Tax=Halosolutus gelatinilyticus TaxID=2931975 RepID=UPI001FF20D90|nr:helix-turn-helix domain-containing protein [Halosolutus gelatinilyticus]